MTVASQRRNDQRVQADRALPRRLGFALTDVVAADLADPLNDRGGRLVTINIDVRHRSPTSSPGRSPHISPVTHSAGRRSRGIATRNNVTTSSIVNDLRYAPPAPPAATRPPPGSS